MLSLPMFAGLSPNQQMRVVASVVESVRAPRLTGAGTSLGAAAWHATALIVPGPAGRRYRDIFTDETIETVERDGAVALPLAQVFASFPVAVLELTSDRSQESGVRSQVTR